MVPSYSLVMQVMHLGNSMTLRHEASREWQLCDFKFKLLLFTQLTYLCNNSSEIVVHIDMKASHICSRFVSCTSIMWISCSATSQRCSTGLRSDDCRAHLSAVNSILHSRNQLEMTGALWYGGYPAECSQQKIHCGHEGTGMVRSTTQVICGILIMFTWY